VIVYTPPGIGDAYWILMKLLPMAKGPIDIRSSIAENDRAHFLNYVKGVKQVKPSNVSFLKLTKMAKRIVYPEHKKLMYMEANSHLERGKRIEEYYPHFGTQFKLDWEIGPDAITKALSYLTGKTNIIVYTSSYKYNTKLRENYCGKFWEPSNWSKIISHLYETIPGVNVIWLGAEYDKGMLASLPKDIKVVVNEPADVVIELLRRCTGFIGYQSGLSIISMMENIPTYMVYFDYLTNLPYTFCPQTHLKNKKLYKPVFFNELQKSLGDPALWASRLV